MLVDLWHEYEIINYLWGSVNKQSPGAADGEIGRKQPIRKIDIKQLENFVRSDNSICSSVNKLPTVY